jgi:hypothetical protein
MKTNLTEYLKERNFERKYGLVATIIVSILFGAFIIAIWPK